MDILFNNKKLDSSKEHEIFADSENGFKVTVSYSNSFYGFDKGVKSEIFYNVTEIHHKYPDIIHDEGVRIAFESDVHCTGCNRNISDINSIVIENCDKIYSNF